MTFGAWLWQSYVTAGECCIVLVNGRGPDKEEEAVHNLFSLCFAPQIGKTIEKPRSVNHKGQ